MRNVIAAVSVAAVALIAAGVLGVAGAETTPTTTTTSSAPPRTVGVEGVATAPVDQAASSTVANTAYRQAMASAVADGQGKAQFLAEKAGATLGPVQSVGEGGGYIQCPAEEEYLGAQPDFGSGAPVAAGPVVAERRAAAGIRRGPLVKPRRRRRSARKATAEPCTLSTQVALVYLLG